MNFNTIQAVSFSLLQLCNESEAETVVTYNQLQLQPGYLDSVYSHLYVLLKVTLERVWSPFV